MFTNSAFPPLAPGASPRTTNSFPAAQEGRPRVRRVLTFNASLRWICPPNVTEALVLLSGGGGGGGGIDPAVSDLQGASGGSGAEVLYGTIRLVPGAAYDITIGAAGVGVAGTDGTAGGNTTMVGDGVFLRAAGGNGGKRAGTAAAAVGTTADSAFFAFSAYAGGASGVGGSSAAGGAAPTVDRVTSAAIGAADSLRGGGGPGGNTVLGQGGAGGAGNNSGGPVTPAVPLPNTGAGGGGTGASTTTTGTGASASAGFLRLTYDE